MTRAVAEVGRCLVLKGYSSRKTEKAPASALLQ